MAAKAIRRRSYFIEGRVIASLPKRLEVKQQNVLSKVVALLEICFEWLMVPPRLYRSDDPLQPKQEVSSPVDQIEKYNGYREF